LPLDGTVRRGKALQNPKRGVLLNAEEESYLKDQTKVHQVQKPEITLKKEVMEHTQGKKSQKQLKLRKHTELKGKEDQEVPK